MPLRPLLKSTALPTDASLRGVALLPGALALALAAAAAPSLAVDLSPYPAPAAGERRWWVQLPASPGASAGRPVLAMDPDRLVEVSVGREVEVDCNLHHFGGTLREEKVKGWGYDILRVTDVGPMISTRMACPPGEPRRRRFVRVGTVPRLVVYNPLLPLVVYAPQDLEVRWRIWKAEPTFRPAGTF